MFLQNIEYLQRVIKEAKIKRSSAWALINYAKKNNGRDIGRLLSVQNALRQAIHKAECDIELLKAAN